MMLMEMDISKKQADAGRDNIDKQAHKTKQGKKKKRTLLDNAYVGVLSSQDLLEVLQVRVQLVGLTLVKGGGVRWTLLLGGGQVSIS